MKNVVLFFGGKSAEHDVSIITAKQVHNSLDLEKYNVFCVYVDIMGRFFYIKDFEIKKFVNFDPKQHRQAIFISGKKAVFYKGGLGLKKLCDVDVCLLANHGGSGENGTIQGFLDTLNLPYTSSGVLSCGVTMDKVFMKDIFVANSITTPKYIYFDEENLSVEKTIKVILEEFSLPVVVKPASLGSSIGISVCKNKNQLKTALELANIYDKKIIVEQYINNLKEANISAFLYNKEILLSKTEEPSTAKEFLSYDKKYLGGNKSKGKGMASIKRKSPANISKQQDSRIRDMAKQAYKVFDCRGIVRIDFLIDEIEDKVYINEINTIPGSLSFYLWKDSFKEILNKLIEESLKEGNKKSVIFKSKILSNFSS